ncbi:hypothetical protein QNH46_12770 [Paenibacillus woosongensis]|uniref:Uncharacterized protein n=1 Tax=Paenibacillus woosongensis TaxID=307580 RepID=A0AA95HYB1_9BACL|nr:hypothetical protein [Paenibacillus woosongensis]WHX47054.1 hypothetical protein QNH46_12770 [Paenibacillus woosongensis]
MSDGPNEREKPELVQPQEKMTAGEQDPRQEQMQEPSHETLLELPREPLHEPPKRNHTTEVFKGIGILALLHLLLIFIPLSYFFIGIAQIVYLIPAAVVAFAKKRVGIGQGLLIGGAVTFLLNAACFGVVMANF